MSGRATEPGVLIQAHIIHARLLVISPYDILDIHQMVNIARQLNPHIHILLCAESAQEAYVLRREALGEVYFAEEEIAKNMGAAIIHTIGSAHQFKH